MRSPRKAANLRGMRVRMSNPTDQNTRLIPLTRGQFAIVDAADYDWLMQWKWHCAHGYAVRTTRSLANGKECRRHLRMHRLIIDAPNEFEVDHINCNRLDNRRSNLRLCSKAENRTNRGACKNATSSYCGVYWKRSRNKWVASIRTNKQSRHLGQFDSEIDAARAYDSACIQLHGKFAHLNFKDSAVFPLPKPRAFKHGK